MLDICWKSTCLPGMRSTHKKFFQKVSKMNAVHLTHRRHTLPLLKESILLKLLPYVVLENLPLLLLVLQGGEEQNLVLILKVALHILLKTRSIIQHYESHERIMKVTIFCEQPWHYDLANNHDRTGTGEKCLQRTFVWEFIKTCPLTFIYISKIRFKCNLYIGNYINVWLFLFYMTKNKVHTDSNATDT